MKKILFLAMMAAVAACNQSKEGSESQTSSQEEGAKVEQQAPATKGETVNGQELIANSDCFACHKEEEKLIGPAYTDVASKYEPTAENIKYLADKIINGGSGVWGDVPMAPHPGIKEEEAKKMAEYILSLKK